MPDPLDRLRGLRGDTEPGVFSDGIHVRLAEHDINLWQVFGQPAHLHVIAPANDDRVITLFHKFCDGAMGEMHERAGGLDEVEATLAHALHHAF